MQLLLCETSRTCTALWLRASLDNAVSRLFRISSLIAKATTRDKFARAEIKCNLAMYEPYDIGHINEKVKAASGKASAWLINRLGKANTKRRQFLAYSREHRKDLSNESAWKSAVAEKERYDPMIYKAPYQSLLEQSTCRSEDTKVSLAPTKASTVGKVDPNTFDYGLDDSRSYTTVATSIADGHGVSPLKVPDLDTYTTLGEHFECPLCYTIQRFNSKAAWR